MHICYPIKGFHILTFIFQSSHCSKNIKIVIIRGSMGMKPCFKFSTPLASSCRSVSNDKACEDNMKLLGGWMRCNASV